MTCITFKNSNQRSVHYLGGVGGVPLVWIQANVKSVDSEQTASVAHITEHADQCLHCLSFPMQLLRFFFPMQD